MGWGVPSQREVLQGGLSPRGVTPPAIVGGEWPPHTLWGRLERARPLPQNHTHGICGTFDNHSGD